MRHSYLLAGITSGNLYQLVTRNGTSLNPKIWLRLGFLAQGSVWASFFNRRQNQKFGNQLVSYEMPDDPVFIIGHWRTGSTFLHQLMALDDNFATPNVFQVSCPGNFLVSEKFYKPVMSKMMGRKRPMDNVSLGFYEPQEDEYALMKMNLSSPLEKLIFQQKDDFFLNDYKDFLPPSSMESVWINKFNDFCKALSFKQGKRVLLKNPFHSMRLPLLKKQYPNAKFIHIHRHPYDVIHSTINMWKVVGSENYLRKQPPSPKNEEVVGVMDKMLNHIAENLISLPDQSKIEISFSGLEKDPLMTIQSVYRKLELNYTDAFEQKLKNKLEALKGYRKNAYSVSVEEKDIIYKTLKKHFIYYNYTE